MLFNIYSFIWTLLCVVHSVTIFIERICVRLRKRCIEILYKDYSVKDEFEFISRQMNVLHKTPSHIVIVLGNESISYKDLANITVWCIAAGISFVSFYDYNGVLKKNEAELFKVLSRMNKGHLENINWGKKSLTNGIIKNGVKNGAAISRKVQVNLFSHADGKESIVDITNSLCKSVLANDLKASEVNQDLLDKMLRAELGVPDPELAICCGPTCSTFGLLPWQIRVTEFLQLQTHHNIKAREFVELLQTYGQCEQRCGK